MPDAQEIKIERKNEIWWTSDMKMKPTKTINKMLNSSIKCNRFIVFKIKINKNVFLPKYWCATALLSFIPIAPPPVCTINNIKLTKFEIHFCYFRPWNRLKPWLWSVCPWCGAEWWKWCWLQYSVILSDTQSKRSNATSQLVSSETSECRETWYFIDAPFRQ